MLRPRITPCLLLHRGGLVKTVRFGEPKYVGDPVNAVRIFNEKEADELIVIDIDASVEEREPNLQLIAHLAAECRMPLCYGGGVRSVAQAKRIIGSGVEKVSISSAFVKRPALASEIALEVGNQSVVVTLDVKKKRWGGGYEVHTHNGQRSTGRTPLDLAAEAEAAGAGELLINAIDQDGLMMGYDLALAQAVRDATHIPLTLLGGAGSLADIGQLIGVCGVIGAAAGSLFVFKGAYRAVLINYPSAQQKEALLGEALVPPVTVVRTVSGGTTFLRTGAIDPIRSVPLPTQAGALTPEVAGRTIVITDGTGTVGNGVVRRFLEAGLREIRDTKKRYDMRREHNRSLDSVENASIAPSIRDGAEPLNDRPYRICSNCIMDTTDSKIHFDARGWCEYCNNYYENILPNWQTDQRGRAELERQIDEIRKHGKGRDHDCLIGLSGGVDSSYVTYLAKKVFGLRPLLFHVDAGWNSQQAVNNIEKLVDGLGLDLYTEVVDWGEMQDLQLAFFKAQVPHLDTPQDHAFFAALYNFAAKHGSKYILTGANYSTECVREPLEWHYHASDLKQLKDIHRRFGTRPLKSFPLASIFRFKIFDRYVRGMRVVKPLNHVSYIKEDAMQMLVDRFGWQRYAHKHYESRFTRFYEGFWLPTKFGYDKRRAHFSSLILTGQMSRAEALERIAQPAYDAETIAGDFEYVATKLGLTVEELRALQQGPNRTYRDYQHSMGLIDLGTRVLRATGVQRAVMR